MSSFFFFNVRGVSVKVYRVKICTKRYWYWFQFCIGCIIGSRLLWVWCPQICCLAIWKHTIILESAPYVNASIIQSLRSAICQKKQLKTNKQKPIRSQFDMNAPKMFAWRLNHCTAAVKFSSKGLWKSHFHANGSMESHLLSAFPCSPKGSIKANGLRGTSCCCTNSICFAQCGCT